MPKILTIGETMAAFTPGSSGPLRYVADYRMRIAGAESNTAIGLAKLGIPVSWVSRLGDDEFGRYVCNQTRAEGVDCSHVIFDSSHRTGIMFKEIGAGETKVFYYRENSAASHLQPEDLVPEMFDGVDILFLTGITPVLSESCLQTVCKAIQMAKQRGILLGFDPNIRKKLWGNGRDYAPFIRDICLDSDIVMLGLDEAEVLFATRDPDQILDLLLEQGHVKYAAIKNGADGAWVADRSSRKKLPPAPCKCVEPIGAGDGFNAGFLAGLLTRGNVTDAGRMGCVCGALATETAGDIEGYPDLKQMEAALSGAEITYR